VARILIIPLSVRSSGLAERLVALGHQVRITTRSSTNFRPIEELGAEPFQADPDRIATLMPALEGVTIVCWLFGNATGDAESVEALHGGRLRMLFEKLVDTPVRGVIYEASGGVEESTRQQGREIAEDARERWQIPVEFITTGSEDPELWATSATSAVQRLLGGESAAQ
jgi:hypothetical protein